MVKTFQAIASTIVGKMLFAQRHFSTTALPWDLPKSSKIVSVKT